jgi:hypothetical protein
MSRWVLSVDLGQAMDPTAIAVLEVCTRRDAVAQQFTDPPGDLASLVTNDWFRKDTDGGVIQPRAVVRVDVRHLERLPLRTSYPDQVAHIAALLRRAPLASPRASLVADMTGVGRPVVDVLRRAGLRPVGVTITAGDKETRGFEGGYEEWRVAKLLLVSHMQASLNEGTLRIAKSLPDARALVEEMQDFRANISEAGYTSFGAREGAHDDLVLSVAIGNWWACRQYDETTMFTVHV